LQRRRARASDTARDIIKIRTTLDQVDRKR